MALTQKDIDEIERLINEKFEEQFKLLPTKDEFFTRTDKIMGELKDMRDELAAVTHRSSDNTDRIEVLEKIHPHGQHASAS